MKINEADLILVVLVITIFTVQFVNTIYQVSLAYFFFALLFYSVGIVLIIMSALSEDETRTSSDNEKSEIFEEPDELKSKEVIV